MNTVTYEINSETFTLEAEDNDTYLKLKADKNFTIYYVKELIKNGFIECENLQKITKINDDTSREIIYDIESNYFSENICESPLELTNNDNNEGNSRKSRNSDFHWNVPVTKFLLDKYEIYLNMVGPLKKFKTKKSMWKKIAAEIKEIFGLTYTELQCENRFKTIKKRKTKAVVNNNTSGSSRMPIEYEEEFEKIAAIDDSIEPEILRGVGKSICKDKNISKEKSVPVKNIHCETVNTIPTNQISQVQNEDVPKKKKCIRDVLLQIHHLKEEQRERRHSEKMELLKAIIENMKK